MDIFPKKKVASKPKEVAKPKSKAKPKKLSVKEEMELRGLNCSVCGGYGLSDYASKGDKARKICKACRGTGKA
jgi:hypothetical protein